MSSAEPFQPAHLSSQHNLVLEVCSHDFFFFKKCSISFICYLMTSYIEKIYILIISIPSPLLILPSTPVYIFLCLVFYCYCNSLDPVGMLECLPAGMLTDLVGLISGRPQAGDRCLCDLTKAIGMSCLEDGISQHSFPSSCPYILPVPLSIEFSGPWNL